ncbi:hypothetical protein M0813_17611 [Anaeramoeba flamelloides]|uniref:ThuA-like domain-containing protein n=1 Tax=Anaeramoeba flamelloides TaxID=1746091 RepID=A0ABQ8YUU5_9EUKA|nr:hypothetical protein M0813_17611 [Anaeramoeba flamelloides]
MLQSNNRTTSRQNSHSSRFRRSKSLRNWKKVTKNSPYQGDSLYHGKQGKVMQTQDIKVLFITNYTDEKYIDDISTSIKCTGIQHLTIHDWGEGCLKSEEMKKYDVIFLRLMCKSNVNTTRLGNSLHKYVISGKGLVIGAHRTLCANDPALLKGKIVTNGFLPVVPGKKIFGSKRKLGEYEKLHPINRRVRIFHGGKNSPHSKCELAAGSKCIAKYDNGTPLVAIKQVKPKYGKVVVLNFSPRSVTGGCKLSTDSWNRLSTGGELIIANSIVFAAQK